MKPARYAAGQYKAKTNKFRAGKGTGTGSEKQILFRQRIDMFRRQASMAESSKQQ